MPSPFPGMDPYLEGALWPDVHQQLAAEIRRRLVQRLRPRYVVRLAVTIYEDREQGSELGIMYPDVEVLKSSGAWMLREQSPAVADWPAVEAVQPPPFTPPPLVLPYFGSFQLRLVAVEVRDAARNDLITAIEIISPVNKREPGLSDYRRKRERLHQAGVHLLEIDLIRRYARTYEHPGLPETPYVVTLTRAQTGKIEVWPIRLQDALPTVPVPLRSPDPDVPLELGAALATIYDEAAYDLSIDYSAPPPPPELSEKDAAWMRSILETIATP